MGIYLKYRYDIWDEKAIRINVFDQYWNHISLLTKILNGRDKFLLFCRYSYIWDIRKIHSFNNNKPGIREKVSNEDTEAEFLFAKLKPEGDHSKTALIQPLLEILCESFFSHTVGYSEYDFSTFVKFVEYYTDKWVNQSVDWV